MKRLVISHGQHFLRGKTLIAELVGHSNIRPKDTVLDIGAGSGAITSVLACRAARVIAYEPEPAAAAKLRQNTRRHHNIEVVQQDFLSAALPDVSYKVFANIPFSLSSKIVRKLVTAQPAPRSIYLIVQKQFAQKLLIDGHHFHGALGMAIAPWWVARIRRPLRKTDFTPPPAVDTVLFELKPRPEPTLSHSDMTQFMAFVEGCYHDPAVYRAAGGDPNSRPSQLAPESWLELYKKNAK